MTKINEIALRRWGTSYTVEMCVDGILKPFFHGIKINDDITLEPIKKQGFSTYYYEKPFKTGFYFINEFEYHFDELYPLVMADVKFNSEYQQKRREARKIALETMRPELGDIATALICDPLTPEQKAFIIETCGSGDIGAIRRTISKADTAENLNHYTWQAIYQALKEIETEARQTREKPAEKQNSGGGIDEQGQEGTADNWHNADYTTLIVDGITYTLNKQQGRVFEYLHTNKTAHLNTIQELLDSQSNKFRLLEVFRQNGKIEPAYNLIEQVENKRGIYRLRFDFSE